jgi:hypothetical protein
MNKKYWSAEVTKKSMALDLEEGVFTWKNPKRIAASLKRSAENSLRRKGTPYQSAMSMLNFYINRAGKRLSGERKKVLEQAKIELRKLFKIPYS